MLIPQVVFGDLNPCFYWVMASRVDQIEFHVRKLAQATGIELEKKDENAQSNRDAAISTSGFDPSVFSSASTVTSDLDIEALSRGLLDISKDLDHYLQTLLEEPDSMLTIKSVSLFLSKHFSVYLSARLVLTAIITSCAEHCQPGGRASREKRAAGKICGNGSESGNAVPKAQSKATQEYLLHVAN